MRTSKHFLLAVAFVLLAGLGASAMAQEEISTDRLPPVPIQPTAQVNAIEVTDGTIGFDNQRKAETAFGYAFLGQTTGSLPGSFTLSMNCTPATPLPGDTSDMTGGAWTLPVYLTGIKGATGYAGSLYGTIANGTMSWDKAGTGATVYMVLNVDGGTQTWDNVGGYATFVGTISIDEKTQEKTLSGDLVFNIISAVLAE
jgi:hypothetical protein